MGVADDIDKGITDRLRSLPVPRLALVGGRALGELVIVAWGLEVTIALSFLVGFRLHGTIAEGFLAFGVCLVCGSRSSGCSSAREWPPATPKPRKAPGS